MATETDAWTLEAIARERARLGIPDDPVMQRNWIRYQLQQRHADTGERFSQAVIARMTFVSESTVSVIYTGGRTSGRKSERARRLTAQVLGIPEAVLFPSAARSG